MSGKHVVGGSSQLWFFPTTPSHSGAQGSFLTIQLEVKTQALKELRLGLGPSSFPAVASISKRIWCFSSLKTPVKGLWL